MTGSGPPGRRQPPGWPARRPLMTGSGPPGRHQPARWPSRRSLMTGSGPPGRHQRPRWPAPRPLVARSGPPRRHQPVGCPAHGPLVTSAGSLGRPKNRQSGSPSLPTRSSRGGGRGGERAAFSKGLWEAAQRTSIEPVGGWGTRKAAFPRLSTDSFSPVLVHSPYGGSQAASVHQLVQPRPRSCLPQRHPRGQLPQPPWRQPSGQRPPTRSASSTFTSPTAASTQSASTAPTAATTWRLPPLHP